MATRETSFCLVYGSEAVIPSEVAVATIRMLMYNTNINEKARERELHLLDSTRANAFARTKAYQIKMGRSYNKGIKPHNL